MLELDLPADPPSVYAKSLFGPVPFPTRFKEFRPHQWDAIVETLEAFRDHDVVFLQAPTGSGKSLIGEAVRRLLHANAIYSCTTKALQDQFLESFPYAKVIKGRSNYETESGKLDRFGNPTRSPYSAITCADCTFNNQTSNCRWCFNRNLCPYSVAKNRAIDAELAVLNTSFLLTDFTFGKKFINRDLVVIDEADRLEDEILSHVEVVVSPRRMRELNLDPPKVKTAEAQSNDWRSWVVDKAIPAVRDHMQYLSKPWDGNTTADEIRTWQSYKDLLGKLDMLATELPNGEWVYDGYTDTRDPHSHPVIFRPVYVNNWGNSLLFPFGDKFLLMSATILSADMMADELGVAGNYTYTSVEVPSTFPVVNRPIYVCPVADMTFKNKDTAWPEMVKGVRGVLARHPNERVLVHTVSYGLAQYLLIHLTDTDRNLVTYSSSRGKDEALQTYSQIPNAVLLAPSMDRGIDLPGDLCRVQVIAKLPFPNVSDKRVKQRLWSGANGKSWYKLQTIRTLIQMTGRAIRSSDDHAVTYILDAQFPNNLWSSKYLFPSYWVDALNFRMTPSTLTGE